MPERISSQSSISSVERSEHLPAGTDAAARERRPSRTLAAGLPPGAGGASALGRRPHGVPAGSPLRRTLSCSDMTAGVAAFSRRFQDEQEALPAARFASARENNGREPAAPRTSQSDRGEHTEQTSQSARSEPAQQASQSSHGAQSEQPASDAHASETNPRPTYSYPVPYFGPHLAPAYTPYFHAPYPAPYVGPHLAPYHALYHWSAQHTYPASGSAFSPHAYASYTQPLPWHPPLPGWLAPQYHSRVVGANSRVGFSYGFGDGPTGKQMHVGFHFNGRFRTLRFGLYPSATRPFFMETHSGRMQPAHAPAWSPAAPLQPAAHAYQAYHTAPTNPGSSASATGRAWHTVLGVHKDTTTVDAVRLQYRLKRQRLLANPSANRAALVELHVAYQNALDALTQPATSEPANVTSRG